MANHFEQAQDISHKQRVIQRFQEMSLLGKMAAGGLAVNAVALTISGVDVVTDKVDETTYGSAGLGLISLSVIAGVILVDRHKNKAASRNYSEDNEFSTDSYSYTDEDGEVFDSPFPVNVVGIRGELLGAGKVIGGLSEGEDVTPVIAIQDKSAKKGQVELLGSECWWTPADEELAEALATDHAGHAITPASYYVRTLEQ